MTNEAFEAVCLAAPNWRPPLRPRIVTRCRRVALKSVRRLFLQSKPPLPRLPDGVRIYAIGDIHGRADLLLDTFSRIDLHRARHPASRAIEIFLGDYVDRGPCSSQVIDLLAERSRTRETIFLKGNHETFFINFLKDPRSLDRWRQYGGYETLLSYGMPPSMRWSSFERDALVRAFVEALPKTHRQFLSLLRTQFTCGDYFFVHAGVNPALALNRQRAEDLLWIRDDFLLSEHNFEKFVIHGHTPVREPDMRHNRMNIDTGAYSTGNLTCVIIDKGNPSVL
jgi:serine/threonine protein phosphatase 1